MAVMDRLQSVKEKQVGKWKFYLKKWRALLLLPASLLLVLIGKCFPNVIETGYSRVIYPIFAGFFGRLTSIFPFSIAEILLAAFFIGILAIIAAFFVHIVRAILGRTAFLSVGFRKIGHCCISFLCCLVLIFTSIMGLNYYRLEFAQLSGLPVRDSSTEELKELCAWLVGEANRLREDVETDANGLFRLEGDFGDTAQEAKTAFGKLSEEYVFFPDLGITPKPMLFSEVMSHLRLTGVFFPYTYEANINANQPDLFIPATMGHELAHTRGFMREDEANFIGYLVCMKSDRASFRYSGTAYALMHALNRLYAADPEGYYEMRGLMSEGLLHDLVADSQYWSQYEGTAAQVSEAVNNTYLRINNQSDGVQSYGRMVDLLLAKYRQQDE